MRDGENHAICHFASRGASLLLGLVIPAILGLADREIGAGKPLFRGRGWAIGALVLVGIDLGVRAVEHHRALHLISNTQFGDQAMVRAGAEPYPVNPFRWFAIVETAGYYQMGSMMKAMSSAYQRALKGKNGRTP